MSENVPDEVSEFDQAHAETDRLRVLLFVIDKKLAQRRYLRFQVSLILGVLMLVCAAILVAAGASIHRVYFSSKSGPNFSTLNWDWYWVLVGALAPLFIGFMHYLWMTFIQMYYLAFLDVSRVLDSTDYEEFRPYLHVEMLAEDGSILSLFHSLLAVDAGLTRVLFALAGFACALFPVAIQAVSSVGMLIILGRDNVPLAIGAGVFYVLFLALSLIKTVSMFAFVRRMR